MTLTSAKGSPFAFTIAIDGADPDRTARTFQITGPAPEEGRPITREYRLAGARQHAYLDLFEALARDFATRLPLSRTPATSTPDEPALRPLLTEAITPDVLYGYGDPSVLHVTGGPDAGWWLLVTSNDAPDAFPILHSGDLETWRSAGFVFRRGHAPAWALTGPDVSDFWAAEMHAVNGEYWVCFAARERDRSLAVGLARGSRPGGPFMAAAEPLVRGGVIDPHLVIDGRGAPWLFWKKDDNEVWPRLLCDLLHRRGGAARLFERDADRRTAVLAQTLWPWARTLEPMEQFFALQPLIEAVTSDFTAFARRLGHEDADVRAIQDALRTRVYAQQLSPDGSVLLGEPVVVLENDQPWEAHLIEGVWVTPHGGRYYMLYAGNDFSTPHYGIGAAIADDLLGPYRKLPEPLLRTSASWSGPGHPSVAVGPDGRRHMFLHAFMPGTAAYKSFRALLTVPVTFEGDSVGLG